MEEYLPQCLDSIVSQTLREIEILCIDDGSTDGSEEVLKLYCNRDSRIRVIKQNNQGVSYWKRFMWELRKIMSALQVEVLWTITMEFIMKNSLTDILAIILKKTVLFNRRLISLISDIRDLYLKKVF